MGIEANRQFCFYLNSFTPSIAGHVRPVQIASFRDRHGIMEQIETVIIGGGQAGLAMSYYLGQLGREHVVLERHRVAERWRSERWDSLTFQSPNWNIQLPGFTFEDSDPDAFASRDEVLRFIERYAAFIRAPLRCGLAATGGERLPPTRSVMAHG